MSMAFLCARALAEMVAGRAPEFFVPEALLPARFTAA
jgi:hypothetical protein